MSQQAKLEDSNIANYGSEEHRDLKQDIAETEEAFKGAGEKPGLEIWRVENFGIKRWPKKQYGTFYQGDSYIVLHTYKDKDSQKLKYDVFFWLGKDTTQDEYGTAAYKTVELDDLLDDAPVQHREVQGFETQSFLKLFPKISLLSGGVESGFNEVKPEEYVPRLLHVKGKNYVTIMQVPLKVSSLNQGDCFILDAGLQIFQWNGEKSNHFERRKALEQINNIKDERRGKPTSSVLDGLEDAPDFWKHFGGKPSSIKEAIPDKEIEAPKRKLFRLSDESGKMKFTVVAEEQEFSRDKLESKDAFIIDEGHAIYVWVGKGASKDEKNKAMLYATRYLDDNDRPITTPVIRVIEGGEPSAFDSIFTGSARNTMNSSVVERKVAEDSHVGNDGVIIVHAHAARNLTDVQTIGKQDPFLVAKLGKQKQKSRVHKDGKDIAKWGDEFRFTAMGADQTLLLICKNDNIFVDKEIGRIEVPLKSILSQKSSVENRQWLKITKDGEDRGEIDVSITFMQPWLIRITEGRDLYDTQTFGKQDPYCELKMAKEVYRTAVHEDAAKNATWEFDNTFSFNVALHDHQHSNLYIEPLVIRAMNKNMISDDEIGKASVPITELKKMPVGKVNWVKLLRKDGKHGGEVAIEILRTSSSA